MKNRKRISRFAVARRSALALCLVLFCAGTGASGAERVDPRVRTFVEPVRVVWKSTGSAEYGERFKVENEASLLKPKHGQVPEANWCKTDGCKLTNGGNVPGIILDFGRELHGGLNIEVSGFSTRNARVRIRFGESVAETCSDALSGVRGAGNDHALRDLETTLPTMGAIEIGNTGFRFVRLDLLTTGSVILEAVRAISLMRPMPRLGAFRSSDERLNRVWETAVHTVHLCCQEHLWDGIKRDRLVWMGDTHPEACSILNVFGAAPVLSDSLDYMMAITPTNSWMNSIPNYTLWFLRSATAWYRFTGDAAWVRARGDYLRATVRHVLANIRGADAAYDGGRGSRVFLDWPTEHNRPAVRAGTRGLLAAALDDAAELMGVAGDADLVDVCRREAASVRRDRINPHGAKSAAALLALGGMRDAHEMFRDVLAPKGHAGVSTFYGYYVLEAMSAAGEHQRALDTVRDYWGAMLDVGATSFWEDFNIAWTNNCFGVDQYPVPGKKDVHGDYGEFCYRGLRHSLCHGWSSGPASWCINHILGIRSLTPGCTRVEVRPFLGDLAWAEGSMALPNGQAVHVRVEKGADGKPRPRVEAPAGVEIVTRE